MGQTVSGYDDVIEHILGDALASVRAVPMVESRGKRLPELFAVQRDNGEHNIEDPLDHVLHLGQVVHGAMHLTLTTRSGQRYRLRTARRRSAMRSVALRWGVLVFRDESERRRNEQALRNADRRKGEFLATLAHVMEFSLGPAVAGNGLDFANNRSGVAFEPPQFRPLTDNGFAIVENC
jgi:hypothetical protein